MIPVSHALSLQRALRDCRVELVEGAGHFRHLDNPDRFARLLRDFIALGAMRARPTAAED